MPSKNKDRGPATRHPLYVLYNGMHARCYNKGHCKYPRYGARGIQVCDRWKTGQPLAQGFWNFVDDMAPRPAGLTLDRVDTDGPYSPENCRWRTMKQQMETRHTCRGTARSKRFTDDDIREMRRLRQQGMLIKDLCSMYGVKSTGLMSNICNGKKWSHVRD